MNEELEDGREEHGDRGTSCYDISDQRPAEAPDRARQAITERYGERTTDVIAMQLEYLRRAIR